METYWKLLHVTEDQLRKNKEKAEKTAAENKKTVKFFCKRSGCVESRTM